MRSLWIFMGVYILISAVACQPLRNAKDDLELRRHSFRKPSGHRDRPVRKASPLVRRVSIWSTPLVGCDILLTNDSVFARQSSCYRQRYSGLASATDGVSELFSRIASRVRGSKTIAETTETKFSSFDGKTIFEPSSAKDLDPDHVRLQPIRRPYAFGGNEAGYSADLDRDHLDAKRYERPPLVASFVDESASRRVDHAADVTQQAEAKKQSHLWNDPKQRPKVMIGVAASATLALLLAQNIRQNQETTQNLNAALASSQAQQQQAAQQAVSDHLAREPSASPRGARLRRRRLDFSTDDYASSSEHASRPVQRVHLQKRFDPIRRAREFWQSISLIQGYRSSIAALRNLPEDTKGLIAKYAIGAAAMLTTGFALLYCYFKSRPNTQPASAPKGSLDPDSMSSDSLPPSSDPRNETIHGSLQKRTADPQKEQLVGSSPRSGRDEVKDRPKGQINKRLVSPVAQTVAMENERSLGSPQRTLENVHPDVRQTMDLSEKLLKEKGPLALMTLSVALTALLAIELKQLVHIYQEETKESSMRPPHKLRHLGHLQAQDTPQALAGAHEHVNVASMRRLIKRMAPIEEANEEGTLTGTTPASVSLDSSAQQSHPVVPRALDRADEAMMKWGPIAISAIVLAGLAFIGFESYKIHQYQHDRGSKNDGDSANKEPSTRKELVRPSGLARTQARFAESKASHTQECSPNRHLCKRMAPAQFAAGTADVPSDRVGAATAEDQLHPRTRLLVALSRENLKKGPLAAVTLVATAFAVTAAAVAEHIRHHRRNWKSGEEPNLHFETSMINKEFVKRAELELQWSQNPSSASGQVKSVRDHLAKRMFQIAEWPPVGHPANFEQQMASSTVVPVEDEPAALVHPTRHISPESVAIFWVLGVVATSAAIGGLYTLFHKDFDKEGDTQHAVTSPPGRKLIKREVDDHSLPQTQQQHRVDLDRRGLFLPGPEDIIEDVKLMMRGARRDRVGPEAQRLGGNNEVQQRQPWMLVLTLMGLATVVVPLAAAEWSWERSRARRQVYLLAQSVGDADQQQADTVVKTQVRKPRLGKRNGSSSVVADAIIEEMRLLPRIRGRRPNRPSPSMRREILRHRQGELFALGIAVTAAGAAGLAWWLPHKSHEQIVKQWDEEMQRRGRADQSTHHNGLSKRALSFADIRLASEEAALAVRMVVQRWRRALLRRRFGRLPALPVQYLGAGQQDQPGRIAWKALVREIGPAFIGAALGGAGAWYLHPKILAAEERIARKRREKAQAAALIEERRVQSELEQQGLTSSPQGKHSTGSPLSKRSLTQMTERVRLAMDDIQSYASKRPLSPAETEARAKRMRKYAVVGVSVAAMEAIKTYLFYALIKSRVEKKERKHMQDEWRQQQMRAQQEPQLQQMQSSEDGPFVKRDRNAFGQGLTTDRRALPKRAGVVPVAEDQMTATREADIDPQFLQRIREGRLLAKDLVIFGAAIAATIGLTYGVAYLVDKKALQLDTAQPHTNFNMHSFREAEIAKHSSQLVKRAEVRPVAEVEMAATQEAEIDPRFLERIRRGALLAKDIAIFGAVAALSFGFSFGVAHIFDRKDLKQDVEQPQSGVTKHGVEHSSQSKGQLVKRADVQPVAEIEMTEAREAGIDPRVEQRLLVTRNVVALTALFATLFAGAVGFTYWTMNHGKPDQVSPPDSARGHGLPGPLLRKRALAADTDSTTELAPLLERRAQVRPLTEYTMRNSQETRVAPRIWETLPRLRGIDYGDALLMMWGAVAVLAGPITLLVKEHQEQKAQQEREEREARTPIPPVEVPISQRNLATQTAFDQNRLTKRADVVPALEAAEVNAGAIERLRSGHKDLAKGAAILLSIFGVGGIVSIVLALKQREQESRAKHGDRPLHKRAGVVPVEEGVEAMAVEADQDPHAQKARRTAWQTTKTVGVFSAAMAIILGSIGGAAYEISKHLPSKNATEAYAPLPHINNQQVHRGAEVASVMLTDKSSTPHDLGVERGSRTTLGSAPDIAVIDAEVSTAGTQRDHRLQKRADPEPAAELEMAAANSVRVDDLQPDHEEARRAAWRWRGRIAAYAATTLAVISAGAGYVYYTLRKGLKDARTNQSSGQAFNGDEDLLPPRKHLTYTRRIERRDRAEVASIGTAVADSDVHSQQEHTHIVERANAESNVPMGALVMRVFRQLAIDSKRAGYFPSASSSSSSSSAESSHPATDNSKISRGTNDPGLRNLEAAVARDLLTDREKDRRRQRSRQQRTPAKRETYLPNQSRMPAAIISLIALVVLYKVKSRVDERQHDASLSHLPASSFGERRPQQEAVNGGISEQ